MVGGLWDEKFSLINLLHHYMVAWEMKRPSFALRNSKYSSIRQLSRVFVPAFVFQNINILLWLSSRSDFENVVFVGTCSAEYFQSCVT